MASLSANAAQNITDAVEEGATELEEKIDAHGRKSDAQGNKTRGAVEEGIAGLAGRD